MEQHPSKPLPANQLAFEQAAMEEICARSGQLVDLLRGQFSSAKVKDRWGSGKGFYTDYEIPTNSTPLPPTKQRNDLIALFEVKDVGLEDDEGFGSVLCQLHWWEDGRIAALECVRLGDRWPTTHYDWRAGSYAPQQPTSWRGRSNG